jgi:exodeoxyribonuclease-3
VLTLNIGAAASHRAESILGWLVAHPADVLVLTETSRGLGTQLLIDELSARGYQVLCAPEDCGRDRGVVLATRVPIRKRLPGLGVTLPWRAIGVVLETVPRVAVVGVYVPSRDRSEAKIVRKQEFIESLLASVEGMPGPHRRHLLVVGDYNAISRAHQPRLPGFFPYEYGMHDELERLGLRAAHELAALRDHPHSWIGRTGNRYLYDYVHAGEALHDRIKVCEYLHEPRELALSDHAAVAVQVRLGFARLGGLARGENRSKQRGVDLVQS